MQLIFTVRFKHFVVFYELMHNKDVFKNNWENKIHHGRWKIPCSSDRITHPSQYPDFYL